MSKLETRNQLVYNALESFEHGEYPSDSILETLGVNRDTARDLMEHMMNRRITREDAYCVLNGTDDGQTLHYTPVTSTDSSQKVFQNRNLAVSSVGGNAQEYESLNRDKANSVTSNNVQRDLVSSAVESFMKGYYPSNKDLSALGISHDTARRLMWETMSNNLTREDVFDVLTSGNRFKDEQAETTQQESSNISTLENREPTNKTPAIELMRYVPGTDAAGGSFSGGGSLTASGVQQTIRALANGTRQVEDLSPSEFQQIGYNLTHGTPNVDLDVVQGARQNIQNWAESTVTRVQNTETGLNMQSAFYHHAGKTINGKPWPVQDKYDEYYWKMTTSERSKALEFLYNSEQLGSYVNSLHLDDRIEKKEFDPNKFIVGLFKKGTAQFSESIFSSM